MITLGIETSCDETAVAVVEDGFTVRANLIAAQVHLHERFGGVVPEVAARAHVEALNPLLAEALEAAGLSGFGDIDGVAVTVGPGLVGALLVGMAAAKSVSLATGADLIGINHLEGHIWANFLTHGPPETPYVALVVSGGHTMIVHMPEPFRYEVLGQTLDDAAGEAFDKVARLIGLGFPGGPALDKMARDGNPDAIRFPRSMERSGDFDFSMSGLKTAVLRHVKAERAAGRDIDLPDLAASFQEAIVDVQVGKTIEAARQLERGHRAAGRRRRREHASARTDGARRERGRAPRAVPAARALHGQRGDDRVRGRRQTRSRGTHVARHRSRSELRVSVVTTVLVTGGAGFIGSHLADRLLAEGYRVISVDDLTTGRIANLAEGRNYGKEFTFFNMDVRSDGVQQLFERHRPEIVFHLAAQSGVRPSLEDPSRDASINIMGTLNVLGARGEGRRPQGDLRRERRHDLRRAQARAREGDPARRAATPRRRTASRRRSWSTTWGSTSATAAWTSPRSRSATSTGRARTRTARPA